nr:hypothetical protein [Tanacetum cinerariifolium]
MPHEASKRVSSLGGGEGSMQQKLQELMDICTNLQRQHSLMEERVQSQDLEITQLKTRVKTLKDNQKRKEGFSQQDAPNTGGMDQGEDLLVGETVKDCDKSADKGSDSTDDMANVLGTLGAANILASGGLRLVFTTASLSVATASTVVSLAVATASGSFPTAVELIDELLIYQRNPTQIKKYQAQQNKPAIKTKRRDFYMSILRSNAGWKVKHFKGMTFEQIEEKFILVWDKMQDFVPMNSKLESERLKRPGIQLGKESFKKLKTTKASVKPLNKVSLIVRLDLSKVTITLQAKALDLSFRIQQVISEHVDRKKTTDQYIFQRRIPVIKEASTRPSTQPQDDNSLCLKTKEKPLQLMNKLHNYYSKNVPEKGADSKRTNNGSGTEILKIDKEQGEEVSYIVALEEKTTELDEGLAGSDPGKTPESQPPPDNDKMDEDQAGSNTRKSYVALAGLNPKPMHDDFMATVYPKVNESLNLPADEQVILEDPLSSSRTLSLMKNLDYTYTFGDQFFNEKPTKDKLGKQNVDAKVISMRYNDHEKKRKLEDVITQAFSSRILTLELRDLPHKINQTVNEVVKEAVHVALQALLQDCFRELPKADMQEILYQPMFESGSLECA